MAEAKKNGPMGWWVLGGLVAIAVLMVVRWCTLPEPKYFWPQTAGDWSAWGAVLGSGGTIGAVIYAARTFKSSADAQLSEKHDRRLEMDYLEGLEADEATKLKLMVSGRLAEESEAKSNGLLAGAYILLKNYSENKFKDLQVVIPHETFTCGNFIANVQFQRGIYLDSNKIHRPISNFITEEKITWEDFVPKLPRNAEMTHFPLGDLQAGEALMIKFDFGDSTIEHHDKWSYPPDPFSEDDEREILVSVSYVDAAGKHWMRSTMDGGHARRLRYPSFEQTF
ncbi:hypothetical protein [Glutamicibacter protophormiae]|uniref:hypothetical protein n=1 Tax=Glutamicibacter protophormiae TaxID=37930 RepID=UPI003A945BF9